MNPEILQLQQQISQMSNELADLYYLVKRKTGLGSADIKGNIAAPSTLADNSVTQAMLQDNAVGQAEMRDSSIGKAELKYEAVDITVTAGNPSGTGTCTSGSIVVGVYPIGNQDQFVDNVAVSGTTVTITLAANATANNQFRVVLLKT